MDFLEGCESLEFPTGMQMFISWKTKGFLIHFEFERNQKLWELGRKMKFKLKIYHVLDGEAAKGLCTYYCSSDSHVQP